MHPELALYDGEMCGEREAALDGRLNEETVPEREHPGPFDAGRGCEVAVQVAAQLADSSIRSARIMTPLFRRAFGNAANDYVARLEKFYERTARKEVLRQRTDYTKRGRGIEEIADELCSRL
jgi:hypothetical protein